jgi:hypothetical protein
MKSAFSLAACAAAALLLLGACHNGSSGGSSPTTYYGYLIDAPAAGIYYTASPSGYGGYTDAQGSFIYAPGDRVSFYLPYRAAPSFLPLGYSNLTLPAAGNALVSVLSLPCGGQTAQVLQALNTAVAQPPNASSAPNSVLIPPLALSPTDVGNIESYLQSCGLSTGSAGTAQSMLAQAQADAGVAFSVNMANAAYASNLLANAPGFAAQAAYDAASSSPSLAFLNGATVLSLSTITSGGSAIPVGTRQAQFVSTPPGGTGTAWAITETSSQAFNALNGPAVNAYQTAASNAVSAYLSGGSGTNNAFPGSALSTASASYADTYQAFFQVSEPDGSAGFGQYYLVNNAGLNASQLSSAVFQMEGIAACSNGLPPVFAFGNGGTSYLSYCAAPGAINAGTAVHGGGTVAPASATTTASGGFAGTQPIPGVLVLQGSLCADAGSNLYVGALFGQSLGTAAGANTTVGFVNTTPGATAPSVPGGVAVLTATAIPGGTGNLPFGGSPSCGI